LKKSLLVPLDEALLVPLDQVLAHATRRSPCSCRLMTSLRVPLDEVRMTKSLLVPLDEVLPWKVVARAALMKSLRGGLLLVPPDEVLAWRVVARAA